MKKKKIITGFVIFAVLAINLAFGLSRIAKYSAVDEPYWTYDRISQFWTAIAKHKWKSTNINDKPGVTTAIIAGPGLWSIDPMPYKSLRQEPKNQETVRAIEKIDFLVAILYFSQKTFWSGNRALLSCLHWTFPSHPGHFSYHQPGFIALGISAIDYFGLSSLSERKYGKKKSKEDRFDK